MKPKHLSLLLFAIVANTSVSFSQNVQTYQGTQAFNSMIGYISGTEKYSYYVNDEGQKQRQGTYSFSGSKELSNNTNQLKGTYTLNTTFANDKLNGTYSVSAIVNGKTWSYAKGWQSFTGSSKLTGVFANGKPNGTFTVTYNGDMKYSGSATLKNGKFVGAYKYSGPGENNSLWNISGQLTADGKLTGNWKVENVVADWHKSFTFLNDVLIADGQMTPQLQNVAKQYAEGKINKETIEKKGYVVKTESLPLTLFINYLLFVNEDEYGLEKMEGWDLSDYADKKYTAIIQLNTITDKGFTLIKDEIIKTNNYNAVYHEKYNCKYGECETFCNSELKYDETCDAYYMQCDEKFSQLYGISHESNWRMYINKKQYDELIAIKDRILIASIHDFAEIFNGYGREIGKLGLLYAIYRNNANDLLGQLPLNKNYNEVDGLYKQSLNQYNDYIKKLYSPEYALRFTKDSTYIIDTDSYRKCAWKNEFEIWKQFNNALYSASLNVDSLEILRRNLQNELNSANISGVKASIINQYFAQNQYGSSINLQSAYNNIVETQQLVILADSIERKHNYIISNVPDELLKNYKKDYKKVSSIKAKDASITSDQYISLFAEIANLQENIIAYNEQLQNAEKINNVIREKGSIYPDILKTWSAKYKKCTAMSDDVNNSLADIKEIQDIGQKLLNYIDLHQHCDSAYTQILNSCGKQYGDVSKPYQAKVKDMIFVPDMTSTETLDKDIATMTEYSLYQDELKHYLQNRQKVDQLNQSIIEKISKTKNVKKLYGAFYKSLPVVWSADRDNFKNIEEINSQLQKVDDELQSKGADTFDPQLKKAKTVDDFRKVFNL